MNSSRWRDGQTITEYLLIFAIVSAAILGMQVYAKRGIQAAVKTAADQMSPEAGDADGRQAQLLGIRQESGDDGRTTLAAGTVLAKGADPQNPPTTTTDQIRTMKELDGGKHETVVVTDETRTTGISTARVVSKVKD